MKTLSIFAICLLSTYLLIGCSTNSPGSSETKKTSSQTIVKIGVITPLSGPSVTFGEDTVNILQERVKEFEKKYNTIDIQLIIEDTKCSGKDGTSAGQKLVHIDKVQAIIGGFCSSETLGAAPIAETQKTVILSPSAASPKISELGPYTYRFRNDLFAIDTVVTTLDSHIKNVAVITENTDYAQSFAQAYIDKTQATIHKTQKFNSDEKDFDLVVAPIVAVQEQIDGIFIANQSDASALSILIALQKQGLLKKFKDRIFVGVGMSSASLIQTIGDETEGIMTYAPKDITLSGENQQYLAYYSSLHPIKGEAMYIILRKDAIDLVLDAIASGHTTNQGIKQYFDTFKEDNKRVTGFGEFYFDENGDAIGLQFSILQVKNGVLTQLQ